MRDLSVSDRNELVLQDARSGSEIVLYYRNPTTKEEAAYNSMMVKKEGKKIKLNLHATRITFGLRILTGFREGDFGVDGKPISSDPASPNYREDWKDLFQKGASDLVAVLGRTVFEGARVDESIDIEDEAGLELKEALIEEEAPGEEAAPFPKS